VASTGNNAPATFPVGSTTVTWTVTDGAGLTATATQVVTVSDSEDPMIASLSRVDIYADSGACDAVYTLADPTPTDACGVGAVVNSYASASYPVGDATVTWTATDNNGRTGAQTQVVRVIDNQAPTFVNFNAVGEHPVRHRYVLALRRERHGRPGCAGQLRLPVVAPHVRRHAELRCERQHRHHRVWTVTDAAALTGPGDSDGCGGRYGSAGSDPDRSFRDQC
jgi:FlaG/FlaF family flagellin (archaellin)